MREIGNTICTNEDSKIEKIIQQIREIYQYVTSTVNFSTKDRVYIKVTHKKMQDF